MLNTSTREHWIDLARGVAIFLVCAFHAATILRFGYVAPSALIDFHDSFAAFRMPLLAFLSGLIAHRSLSKPPREYYLGKARALLYPYVLWTAIFAATAGRAYGLFSTAVLFSYLWYLGFIFIFYVILRVLNPVPKIWLIAASLVLAAWIPQDLEAPIRFFFLFSTFALGALISEEGAVDQWKRFCTSRWTLIGVPLVALLVIARITGSEWPDGSRNWKYDPGWFFSIASGIALACGAAIWIDGANRAAWLDRMYRATRFVGRNSVVYYLTHYPVIYSTVLLLKVFGIQNVWVVYFFALVTSCAVGTSLVLATKRFSVLRWIYEMPSAKQKTSSSAFSHSQVKS